MQFPIDLAKDALVVGQRRQQEAQVGHVHELIDRGTVQQRILLQSLEVALEEPTLLRAPQRRRRGLLPQHTQAQQPIQAVGLQDWLSAEVGESGVRRRRQGAGCCLLFTPGSGLGAFFDSWERSGSPRSAPMARLAICGGEKMMSPAVPAVPSHCSNEAMRPTRRSPLIGHVGQLWIEQARLEQVEERLQTVLMAQRHHQFDGVAQRPARLPAVADQRQQLPPGRLQLGESAVQHGGVVDGFDAAADQFLDRPLVARPDEPARHLAQQRLVVTLQRLSEAVGPGGGIGRYGMTRLTR